MAPSDLGLSRRRFLGEAGGAALAASLSGVLTGSARAAEKASELPDGSLATDRRIRIGVVGGGFGSTFQWHEHPNCIVHAVSDLRADRREHLMKTYRCERSYESLEKLILDRALEAVAVFTGAPDHVRHCAAVMNAGKHAICAVPAAMNLEEAAQLLDTKKRTGRRYMMAETSCYRSHCIAARDLFNEGKFGELFYSEVEYYHPLGPEERAHHWWQDGERTWRHGYAPMLYPTHSTGFLVGVTRERLTEVACLGWGAANDPDLKGNQYNNPFSAAVALGKTDRGHMCRFNVIFSGVSHGERAQWFGTKLSYYMPGTHHEKMRIVGPGAPDWAEVPDFHERLPASMRHDSGHGGSHTFLTHEFIAALVEEREPAIDVYESLAMTVPGIIAQQSALKGGEQMRVPSFDERS